MSEGNQKESLTGDSLIWYVQNMKVKIRPTSRHSYCSKCRLKFTLENKFECPQCGTQAKKFRLDIHHQNNRVFIYSDKQGQAIDSFNRATKLASHIQYEIDNHIFDPTKYKKSDIKRFLFETQVEEFYDKKKKELAKGNLSPSYVKYNLRNYIYNYWIPFFKGRDVREINANDIEDFYYQLPDNKEKTYKNIMDGLRHFFKKLADHKIIDKLPIFPEIDVEKSIPMWTTEGNQWMLIKAIPESDRPIFIFILFQGVRPSEARALWWEDIDLDDEIVYIKKTFSEGEAEPLQRTKGRGKKKNRQARALHPYVIEMLKSLQKGLPKSYIFINPRTKKHYARKTLDEIFKKAREKTGIDINLCSAGRHSVATNAIMNGADIFAVRDYLGHSDSRTTEKYYIHISTAHQRQIFKKAKLREIKGRE